MVIDYGQAQSILDRMIAARQRIEFEMQKQMFESHMNESTKNTINGEYSVVDVKRIDHG